MTDPTYEVFIMKVRSLALSLLLPVLGVACGRAPGSLPSEATDLSRHDLVGPVKSCTYHVYRQYDDVDTLSVEWPGELLEQVKTCFFDLYGMMIYVATEDIDGHSTETAYFHDEDHRVVEMAQSRAPGTFLFKESHVYDKDGKRVECLKIAPLDDPARRVTYTYDDKRRLVEERSYISSDTVVSRVVYAYNEAGKVSKISNYFGMNTLASEEVCTYDVAGVLKYSLETYTDDDHHTSIESHYDRQGRLTETTMSYLGGGYRKQIYTYGKYGSVDKKIYIAEDGDTLMFVGIDRTVCDEKGRTTEESFLEPADDGELYPRRRLLHRYDDQGRAVETLYLDSDGHREALRTWQYEYDTKGNWIRQIISYSEGSESDIPVKTISVTTRKIEYYE